MDLDELFKQDREDLQTLGHLRSQNYLDHSSMVDNYGKRAIAWSRFTEDEVQRLVQTTHPLTYGLVLSVLIKMLQLLHFKQFKRFVQYAVHFPDTGKNDLAYMVCYPNHTNHAEERDRIDCLEALYVIGWRNEQESKLLIISMDTNQPNLFMWLMDHGISVNAPRFAPTASNAHDFYAECTPLTFLVYDVLENWVFYAEALLRHGATNLGRNYVPPNVSEPVIQNRLEYIKLCRLRERLMYAKNFVLPPHLMREVCEML